MSFKWNTGTITFLILAEPCPNTCHHGRTWGTEEASAARAQEVKGRRGQDWAGQARVRQPWRPAKESDFHSRGNEKTRENSRQGNAMMWLSVTWTVQHVQSELWEAGPGARPSELGGWTTVGAVQVMTARADICQLSVPDTVFSTNICEFTSHYNPMTYLQMKKWGAEKWYNFPQGTSTGGATVYPQPSSPSAYPDNDCTAVTDHRWAQGLIWR